MKKIVARDSNGKNWIRVSKTVARKIYAAGEPICLCPSNFRPFGCWHHGIIVHGGIDFEKLINRFSYYNCNSETGRYVSFYTAEK